MLGLWPLAAVTLTIATPAGFGSADRKIKAKTPVVRPVKRKIGAEQRDAVARKEAVDARLAVVVSDLALDPGATLPEDVDFAALVRAVLKPSTKLRLVFLAGCTELACCRAQAAAQKTAIIVLNTLGADGRVQLLLNELPGQGLLKQRQTKPLEARDRFDAAVQGALSDLLAIGTDNEAIFSREITEEAPKFVGETAAQSKARAGRIRSTTYGVMAGAGLTGLGLIIGAVATLNASQWRATSYRHTDGLFREQLRRTTEGRAFIADLLLTTGVVTAGAGYYLQRSAVAGPGGKMTLGWGQDTWKAPEEQPSEPADEASEDGEVDAPEPSGEAPTASAEEG
jgi:hypothetical protein